MGRNKKLRLRIAGQEGVIASHEQKIREEGRKDNPDEGAIESWKREIEAARKTVARMTRRLKREW